MDHSCIRRCGHFVIVAASTCISFFSIASAAFAGSNKVNSGADLETHPCIHNCPVEKLRGDLPYRAPPKPSLNPVHCHYVGWGGHKELVCD